MNQLPLLELEFETVQAQRAQMAEWLSQGRGKNTASIHSLLTGDAWRWLRKLPDASVDLAVTSPVYGNVVKYSSDEEKSGDELGRDDSDIAYYRDLDRMIGELYRVMKAESTVVLNVGVIRPGGRGPSGKNALIDIVSAMRGKGNAWKALLPKCIFDLRMYIVILAMAHGFSFRHEEIWERAGERRESHQVRSSQNHEYICILTKGKKDRCVRRRLSAGGVPNGRSVFCLPKSGARYGHPASFHPQLPERYIYAYSDPGDIVLDFMSGSGTTALAALKHGRDSISIELYEKHQRVALNRLSAFAENFRAQIQHKKL
jgi:site-specific DNA-methyltransferase (adenine-specific)